MNKNINERLKITVIGCGQAGGSITARIEESVNDLGGNKANTSFVGINTRVVPQDSHEQFKGCCM